MSKLRRVFLINIIVIIIMIIHTIPCKATTATITTDTLKLRSEPLTTSSVLELLELNEKVEVIENNGEWIKVKYKDIIGYVSSQYIKIEEDIVPSEQNITTNIDNSKPIEKSDDNKETLTVNTITKVLEETNVKILPLINSIIIGNIKKDTEIKILSKTNNWVYIENDEISGWIRIPKLEKILDTSNIEENEENIIPENTYTSTTKYVNTSAIYVRSKSSTDSEIVTSLILNTNVTVVGEEGDWYKVKYNNINGFIRKDLLSDSKIEETSRNSTEQRETKAQEVEKVSNTSETLGNQITEYAKQFLGIPYKYGTAGPLSFDCSGFTSYVYKHFGYSLDRSAIAQSKNGKEIEKSNLQVGDIVCFLDYETMDKIGHVGIYLGDGNFIHASSGSGYCVKISTLLSGSYNKRYVTARRII